VGKKIGASQKFAKPAALRSATHQSDQADASGTVAETSVPRGRLSPISRASGHVAASESAR
jgi:hypothetical protein